MKGRRIEFRTNLPIGTVASIFRARADQRTLMRKSQITLEFVDPRGTSPFAQYEDAEFEVLAVMRPRMDATKALPGVLRGLAPDLEFGVWLRVDSTDDDGCQGELIAIAGGKICRKAIHAVTAGIREMDPGARIKPEEAIRL